MKMPTDKQARELEFTKSELAGLLYHGVTFDTALPQQWVDEVTSENFDPRTCVVWGYTKRCSVLGEPLALTTEAYMSLLFLSEAERERYRAVDTRRGTL